MNLQPIMAFTQGTLFRDLQDFVRDGIVNRIDEIVYRSKRSSVLLKDRRGKVRLCDASVWPLFQRDTKEFIGLAADGLKSGQHPSCFNHFHNTIAETTLILLLGQVISDLVSFCKINLTDDIGDRIMSTSKIS